MSPLEILALILVVLGLVKFIVILIKPGAWAEVPKTMFAKPMLSMIISLILAALVLKVLLAEMTIVHVFAVMLFMMLLMFGTMSMYHKELMPMVDKMLKSKDLLRRAWLPIVIWSALMIWVLVELFI
jgi:hypothetical protein